ncbi:putative cucumisin [Helianthus anomalus]
MVPDQLAEDVADPTTMPSSNNTTGHQSTGSRTNMEKTMDTLQKPLVMTRLTSLEERVDELLKARQPLCLKAEIPTTSDLFGPFDHVEDRVVVGKVSSESDIICVQGYNIKQSVGYKAEFGNLDTTDGSEFLSPRDAYGHGTHTSSIASEAIVKDTSFFGLARGGAPSSHLPIYKVCWATGGCSSADILAAFYDSIHDGVDVISVSLGTSPPLPTYLRGLFLWLQAPLIEFSPPPLRYMCYCELHGRALGPDGMVSRGNAQDKL